MGFDFIVIAPLLPSHCGFSFVFGWGGGFGEFQCLPVDDCSTVSCDCGDLTRGSEHMSFYSAILTQSPIPSFLKWYLALASVAHYFHGFSLISPSFLFFGFFSPGFFSSVQIKKYLYTQVFFLVPLLSHHKFSMNYVIYNYGF